MQTRSKSLPWAIALAATLVACSQGDNDLDIFGAPAPSEPTAEGEDAEIESLPWQVSLQSRSGEHFCGGSVIDARWVLTAARCVEGLSADGVRVVAGVTHLSESDDEGQVRDVFAIHSHPDYVEAKKGSDVALLELDAGLELSSPKVSAVALGSTANEAAFAPGKRAIVSGWGTMSAGGGVPEVLRSVTVPIVSNEDASTAYAIKDIEITPDQIGAATLGQGGGDSCQGDRGGPMVVADGTVLAGVVSWGESCGDPDFPGMYARVSSFHEWIQQTMGAPGDEPPPGDDEEPPPPPGGDPGANSCMGACGDAPAGEQCWCDPGCEMSGDCCPDYQAVCGGGGGQPPPPPPGGGGGGANSCMGVCGDAPAGEQCWCDPGCEMTGDCCPDFQAVCGGGGGGGGGPSCMGFCGDGPPEAECFCDFECERFGDCCPDFQAVC